MPSSSQLAMAVPTDLDDTRGHRASRGPTDDGEGYGMHVLTPPSSPPAVQLSSAPSLYPSWAPYQPTPTLSTPPTPTPRGPNFSPPSSAHGHSAESAGSGADARLLSASVHDGLDPTWARAAVLEEEDGSGALEEGDRGFAEPVKRGKGGTDGRQGSRALPEIWTHAAKVYLASTACFAGFTLALVVALEVAQAASNQAVIARFNLYLQIPVILCQLFLLCSAWVAVQSQNMVLVFFVTAFNVYLVLSGVIEAAERTAGSGRPRDRIYPTVATPTAAQNRAILAVLWSVPAADLLFQLGTDWSAWAMYRELGWSSYKRASASIPLRRLYRRFLVLNSLLLFSFAFCVLQTYVLAFTSISMTLAMRNNVHEQRPIPADILPTNGIVGLFVGFLCLYVLALLATAIAVRREHQVLMLAGLVGQTVYVGFSSYSVYFLYEVDHLFSRLTGDGDSAVLLPVKTLFQTIVADVLVLATLGYSIWVGRRFGRGLKEVLDRDGRPASGAHRVDLS